MDAVQRNVQWEKSPYFLVPEQMFVEVNREVKEMVGWREWAVDENPWVMNEVM